MEREEPFRRIADRLPVMVWLAGPDLASTFLNSRWLQFTGQAEQEGLGEGWLRGFHSEDLPHFQEAFRRASAAGREFRVDHRLQRADGDYRWIENTGAPLYPGNGPCHYIGAGVEVTDRRRLEDALRGRDEEAARGGGLGAREASRFIHDLRNCLASLNMGVETIRIMPQGDPAVPEAVKVLKENVRRMSEMLSARGNPTW